MKVIGTAGHVDHGKSALVEALTGIHPDRLKEEQERQMTIDLGFAWLDLPSIGRVGIIDVPGHRDFIDNMLAGVGGIDAVILVIAADEGIMPQTREHLAILDLLGVSCGVVAITKVDLVQDPEWLELIIEETSSLVAATALAGVPILPVSARSGDGIDDLKHELERVLADAQDRKDLTRPRLPVDRAFSIAGFGTVVTGTLTDGSFSVGDQVVVLPSGKTGRVRGLQTHMEKLEQAAPGSRVAMNLSGVNVDEIQRGDVITRPDEYGTTQRLDVRFTLIGDAVKEMRHNQRVKFFHAAAQRPARIRLLGADRLDPGETGWMQIELDAPVVAVRGDRFILRRPSPGATLGGGVVIDPHPIRRYRRKDAEVLDRLEKTASGTPTDVIEAGLIKRGPLSLDRLSEVLGMLDDAVRTGVQQSVESGRALILGGPDARDSFLIDQQTWKKVGGKVSKLAKEYHQRFPLRSGIPIQELRGKLTFEPRLLAGLLGRLMDDEVIRIEADQIALTDFSPQLNKTQQQSVEAVLETFKRSPYTTPSVKDLVRSLGEEVFDFLISEGMFIRLGEDVVFQTETYQAMVERIKDHLARQGTITVAEVRDLFSTTRKYALAFMEHLDQIKVTVRDGDVRRLA